MATQLLTATGHHLIRATQFHIIVVLLDQQDFHLHLFKCQMAGLIHGYI